MSDRDYSYLDARELEVIGSKMNAASLLEEAATLELERAKLALAREKALASPIPPVPAGAPGLADDLEMGANSLRRLRQLHCDCPDDDETCEYLRSEDRLRAHLDRLRAAARTGDQGSGVAGGKGRFCATCGDDCVEQHAGGRDHQCACGCYGFYPHGASACENPRCRSCRPLAESGEATKP